MTRAAPAGRHGDLLRALAGALVVSCQSDAGDPFHGSQTMAMFAAAAEAAGARGVRVQGLEDITLVHNTINLPQIGLWKTRDTEGVFITPTLQHALAVAAAGAEIIALDGTRRPRPDGLTLRETIEAVHHLTDALVMADVATVADGQAAQEAGADCVATTLAGYTADTRGRGDEPDIALVRALADILCVPVFAEGRIHTPDQAAAALAAGAHAVVVGRAITNPTAIASRFVAAMRKGHRPQRGNVGLS